MSNPQFNPFREAIAYLLCLHKENHPGNQMYICHALSDLMFDRQEHMGLIMGAKAVVMRQIVPHMTFSMWARKHIPGVDKAYTDGNGQALRMVMFYRHQFLEHLASLYDAGLIDTTHPDGLPRPARWNPYEPK